jgi:NAD(P)-dependent dehydrogenase (short-subunit alcohol dehydrogenase family)
MFKFDDKVAMITGPAGNLGNAVAKAFQQAGAKLVLVDRHPDRLEELFPELADSPNHFLAPSVDVTDPEAVAAMVAEALKTLGRVDVLVNTVGGYKAGDPVHEMEVDTLDYMFDLNVRSVFNVSHAVIPSMLEQEAGKIVNIAAKPGLQGGKNTSAYSAAKSAVIRLTESMAAELKRKGVNVNCVLPSIIDTPSNRKYMSNATHSRWVTPESLAEVIMFLASDTARDIHGAAIPVYGTV